MPVWRDDWDGNPQVLVIAPGAPRRGVLRRAIVLLRETQEQAVVTLSDALGQRLRVTLPPDLLDSGDFTVESNASLPVQTL